ncbi:MAG: hypothetical protein ACLGQH_09795 [Acidobacteriota bacterium]
MGRKQAHLTGGITGRDIVWDSLRALRETGVGELSRRSGQPKGLVEDYLKALGKAGIVEVVDEQMGPLARLRRVYRLVKDQGLEAPRVRKDGTLLPASGRQRMWRAMGILKDFSPRDLAATASLPEAPVALAEAVYYCRWLEKGGYLKDCGHGRYVVLLAMRHGPRAPMIQRVRRLLDPNTGEILCETIPVEEKAR